MALVVSALSNYVNDQRIKNELLRKTTFDGETASYATKQPGIKTADNLHELEVSALPQEDSGCSFNATGSATFTKRVLTVSSIKYQDKWCPKTLEAKATQLLLSSGSNYTEADIPSAIVDELMAQIAEQLETADWQGDDDSVSAYLNRYDGLLKIIDAETIGGTATATAALTTTNIRGVMRDLITKVPTRLKGKPGFMFFCGYDVYELYINALAIDNNYHIFGQQTTANYGEIQLENSIYKLKAVHGLDGLNTAGKTCIVGVDPKRNFRLGCDMLNEEEDIRIWESLDDQDIKYSIKFKRGWQVAYPTEIIKYANS